MLFRSRPGTETSITSGEVAPLAIPRMMAFTLMIEVLSQATNQLRLLAAIAGREATSGVATGGRTSEHRDERLAHRVEDLRDRAGPALADDVAHLEHHRIDERDGKVGPEERLLQDLHPLVGDLLLRSPAQRAEEARDDPAARLRQSGLEAHRA